MRSRGDFEYSARIPPISMRPRGNPMPLEEANIGDDKKSLYATRVITFILSDYDGNITFIEKEIYCYDDEKLVKKSNEIRRLSF